VNCTLAVTVAIDYSLRNEMHEAELVYCRLVGKMILVVSYDCLFSYGFSSTYGILATQRYRCRRAS
jgi:hypothetical protein